MQRYLLVDKKIAQFLPGFHPQRVKLIALMPGRNCKRISAYRHQQM
jgi:hypothetical protein